ncbi:MAG: hypothetical protein ACWGQW_07645, partial [bacterium]
TKFVRMGINDVNDGINYNTRIDTSDGNNTDAFTGLSGWLRMSFYGDRVVLGTSTNAVGSEPGDNDWTYVRTVTYNQIFKPEKIRLYGDVEAGGDPSFVTFYHFRLKYL